MWDVRIGGVLVWVYWDEGARMRVLGWRCWDKEQDAGYRDAGTLGCEATTEMELQNVSHQDGGAAGMSERGDGTSPGCRSTHYKPIPNHPSDH